MTFQVSKSNFVQQAKSMLGDARDLAVSAVTLAAAVTVAAKPVLAFLAPHIGAFLFATTIPFLWPAAVVVVVAGSGYLAYRVYQSYQASVVRGDSTQPGSIDDIEDQMPMSVQMKMQSYNQAG